MILSDEQIEEIKGHYEDCPYPDIKEDVLKLVESLEFSRRENRTMWREIAVFRRERDEAAGKLKKAVDALRVAQDLLRIPEHMQDDDWYQRSKGVDDAIEELEKL